MAHFYRIQNFHGRIPIAVSKKKAEKYPERNSSFEEQLVVLAYLYMLPFPFKIIITTTTLLPWQFIALSTANILLQPTHYEFESSLAFLCEFCFIDEDDKVNLFARF